MKAIYICGRRHSKQSMRLLFVSDKTNFHITEAILQYCKSEWDIDLLSDEDIQWLINNNQTQNRDENFMIENVELL